MSETSVFILSDLLKQNVISADTFIYTFLIALKASCCFSSQIKTSFFLIIFVNESAFFK